jgi:hypothetical protein
MSTTSTSVIGMLKGDLVTYEDLTPEHKQKFNEIKVPSKPISSGLLRGPTTTTSDGRGSCPKALSMEWIYLSHWKSAPEVNYMVAHSLHWHSESLVNAFERVALCIVQEIMKNQYSSS